MTTVALQTLGCRLNHSETEVLARSFRQRGYTVVAPDGAADVLVVNTCRKAPAVLVAFLSLSESGGGHMICLLYTSPSPRDQRGSRMPSSA